SASSMYNCRFICITSRATSKARVILPRLFHVISHQRFDSMTPQFNRFTTIMQWAGMGIAMAALAGCSFIGFHPGGPNVVDSAVYCGTTSQQSAVHYFAPEADLSRWIDYRGIREFDADAAADGGAIVVEMGQRMTGGYEMELLPESTHIEGDTLYLGMAWTAPPHYAAISQALTAPCMVIEPPEGQYDRVVVIDQLGNTRGTARIH